MGGAPCPKPTRKRKRQEPVEKIQLQHSKYCWGCGECSGLEEHHCLFGSSRQKADKYGLTVWLCADCHRGNSGAHFNRTFDLTLKRYAQAEFEAIYSRGLFMQTFGKNYLD